VGHCKAMLREKFIGISAYIKKNRDLANKLMIQLNLLEK
jgi:hypothetical protein